MELKEIEGAIKKHHGEQREDLVNFYRHTVENALEEARSIRARHVQLACDVIRYLPQAEAQAIIEKIVSLKADQVSTYVLSNFNTDLSKDKTHFSSISQWMTVLVEELKVTFYEEGKPINKDLAEAIHRKVVEQLKLIFCTSERFNSAGNQLLIDLKKYEVSFEEAREERAKLAERVRKNFNAGKMLPKNEIDEIYDAIESGDNKRGKTKVAGNSGEDNNKERTGEDNNKERTGEAKNKERTGEDNNKERTGEAKKTADKAKDKDKTPDKKNGKTTDKKPKNK